jgi:DNA-3-methyladenine glycosylase II
MPPACRRPPALPANPRKAIEHLRAVDLHMARAIDAVGPFNLRRREANLHLLCASIIGQSISIKAAASIVGRFNENVGEPEGLTPGHILAKSEDELKSLGVNRMKATAMLGLANVWQREQWTPAIVRDLPDDVLVDKLTQVRGIGPWTVKMFLIFGLRRPDVMPHEDLGFIEGLRRMRGLKERPKKRADIEAITACWRPWRTVGVIYAWQYLLAENAVDLDTAGGWW